MDSGLEMAIARVAEIMAERPQVMSLTGAGISVESGIPAFRGAQGLWEKYDPMDFASIESFMADPKRVWGMLLELEELVLNAQPNPAHQAMAELEKMGRMSMVVTQNIDGLHQAAGNNQVIEFHGSGRRLRCLRCRRLVSRLEVDFASLPPRCACGGLIKPDVVFFGEPIPERAAMTAFAMAQACDVMLVVGTSAVVAPASHLPLLAKSGGAVVVEINPEPTPLTGRTSDHFLQAGAAEVLPRLVKALRPRLAAQG